MANLKITAKDGKILNINVPEGTDQSLYSTIVDDIMKDYESKSQQPIDLYKTTPMSPVAVPGTLPPGLQGRGQKPFQTMEEGGTKLTEDLGASGVPAPLSAAAGLGFQMASDVALGAVPGLEAARPVGKVATSLIKKASDVAFAPTLKTAGKAIGAAEKVAGIEVPAINEALPRSRKSFIEMLKGLEPVGKASVEKARNLGKETLNIIRKETGDALDFLNVAKQNKSPKQLLTKREIAELSKIKDIVTKALSKEAPEVGTALKKYASSAKRADLMKKVGKGLGIGAGAGIAYGLGSSLINKLK